MTTRQPQITTITARAEEWAALPLPAALAPAERAAALAELQGGRVAGPAMTRAHSAALITLYRHICAEHADASEGDEEVVAGFWRVVGRGETR
jgi:hypothetical protein